MAQSEMTVGMMMAVAFAVCCKMSQAVVVAALGVVDDGLGE